VFIMILDCGSGAVPGLECVGFSYPGWERELQPFAVITPAIYS